MNTTRKNLLASIHIAKSKLGLDDDAYRDLIYDLFKQRSSGSLTDAQLSQFVTHLNSLQKRAGLNTAGTRHEAMIKKCEALWVELRKAGVVHNGSIEALQAFVQSTTGATALRMANGQQLYKAVEALKSWLARAQAKKDKG
jgi:phage gp16-like protein